MELDEILKNLQVAFADKSMSLFSNLIGLGLPVEPEVCAVIYNESLYHSFKKSMVKESALKMRFKVLLMESAMKDFYYMLEHRLLGILEMECC